MQKWCRSLKKKYCPDRPRCFWGNAPPPRLKPLCLSMDDMDLYCQLENSEKNCRKLSRQCEWDSELLKSPTSKKGGACRKKLAARNRRPDADVPDKALKVQEPYATQIVNGEKSWELRRTNTSIRGRVGIASGGKLLGEAVLTDVRKEKVDDLQRRRRFRQLHNNVSNEFIGKYSLGNKNQKPLDELFVWVFEHPKVYNPPLHFEAPRGSVVWVNLRESPGGPITIPMRAHEALIID